jgi:L-serine dehydratase
MKKSTLFDIISPIMIGPSSSHTAGAVRLGLLAKNIYKDTPKKVVFKLYNSYAHTGKGHGTEKGLLAGVLGFGVDDRRIKDIFDLDISKTIDYSFEYYDNFKHHPNAVDIEFFGKNNVQISGESVGAGEIAIRKINDFNVKLTGKYNTLLIVHKDKPGMISQVTSLLQYHNINIASLYCDRSAKGQKASMIVSIDGGITSDITDAIEEIPEVYVVSYIEKLKQD